MLAARKIISPGYVELDAADFETLRRLIRELSGIHLTDEKRALVCGRLNKRLRVRGIANFRDYIRCLRADASGAEARELVNAITTNKTSFFRESHHFDFLTKTLIPELVERAKQGGERRLRIWSAGCSTGQEPWTIAMVVRAALGSLAGWDVRILASDLDTNVLEEAEAAIYPESALADIPPSFRSAFERLPDGRVRLDAELRQLVSFRQINLVEPSWPIRTKFHAVFCRNVAIYFDRPTQQRLFESLAGVLEPGGCLFAGHSENLHWLGTTLTPIGGTIHKLAKSSRVTAPSSMTKVETISKPQAAQDVAITAGGLFASAKGDVVRTLLGSCVAVCLYDPQTRVGGMNHFMLPDGGGPERNPAAFGVNAMELLINAMMKHGADRRRFVAKVFGASTIGTDGGSLAAVAPRNARFALEFLEAEGIPVLAQKMGGRVGLSVRFETSTGRAFVREIRNVANVERTERQLRSAVAKETSSHPMEDDIVVFEVPR